MRHPRLIGGIAAGVLAIAIPLVSHFEGTVNEGYVDPVGIVTACTGHTETAVLGKTYTEAECDDLLAGDLFSHDADIAQCIQVPLKDHEHAAFLSFAFNVGSGAFCRSTMLRKINEGDIRGACAELSRWTFAGGRELRGLVRRRAAERSICEGDGEAIYGSLR
jgi:lysozyme